MPLAALGAGRRQHQPGGARIHAGRAQRADAGRRSRPQPARRRRASPASRSVRPGRGRVWCSCATGQSPADPGARVLGVVEWASAEGRSYDAPSTHDARSIFRSTSRAGAGSTRRRSTLNDAVQRGILEFLQQLAVELGRGNPEPLIAASKLRFDELAIAYQSDADVAVQRFRDHVQGLYAAKALKVMPPVADELVLRPLVDGRLIECLAPTGGPALRTSNDAPELGEQAWPIRLAMVEGRIYVLR